MDNRSLESLMMFSIKEKVEILSVHESVKFMATFMCFAVSYTTADNKFKLKNTFTLLLPLATQWKTIGTLLGIEKHILDKIKSDEDGVNDRLQEMLSEWHKQIDPLPTWRDLAKAVERVDPQKAKEIRTYADIS